LFVAFWVIILFNQVTWGSGEFRGGVDVALGGMLLGFILPIGLLSVAPAKAISRRLIFLALGLLLLIALNELSKLGLDVTAPKLQG
jgi:hypothetical protein